MCYVLYKEGTQEKKVFFFFFFLFCFSSVTSDFFLVISPDGADSDSDSDSGSAWFGSVRAGILGGIARVGFPHRESTERALPRPPSKSCILEPS